MIWLLLVAATLPNPLVTPGVVRPLSLQAVCHTQWGKDRRHVTVAMKRQVAVLYGVKWEDRHLYEFDHLVPRELGGADNVLNLWPEVWVEAHRKDRLENRLKRLVCSGQMSLKVAQESIRTNWVETSERLGVMP